MSKISRQVSDVSDITLAYTNAEATITPTSTGSATFAGLIISRSGRPNVPLRITAENFASGKVLGKPFHMREGAHAEGARHLAEALVGGDGYVVRVMPADARYPILTVDKTATAGKNPVAASDSAYGIDIAPNAANDVMSFYLIDGDNELKRSITFVAADAQEYGDGMFMLTLLEENKSGDKYELESHIVSFDVTAFFNGSAFIEDVLIRDSSRLRCEVTLDNVASFEGMDETVFAGGTSGTYSTIGSDEYTAALNVLRQSEVDFTHVLGLGCYNDVALQGLKNLADERNIQCYYDIEPNLSYSGALTRATALAMNSVFSCAFHFPFSAKDPFFEGRSSWGLSGFAFAAKSRGISKSQPVGGWHYSFAGVERGTITRTGLQIHANAGEPNYEEMVKKRINKVAKNSAGFLMIDDSLTSSIKQDQLRFEHVVAVDCAIGRAMVSLFQQLKHEPDGVTLKALKRGTREVLQRYVTSEALVPPRDPADGSEPFVVHIEQVESDLWSIRWDICITGTARRMTGQSRLFR